MRRYCKKPIIVEAEEWFDKDEKTELTSNVDIIKEGAIARIVAPWNFEQDDCCKRCNKHYSIHGTINTLEGTALVCPGDFIIRGIKEMAILARENLFGAWAFLIGVVLALAVGILSAGLGQLNAVILALLVILGIVVGFGFVSVSHKDINAFLLASVSLVIVSFAGAEGIAGISFLNINIGNMVSSTLGALLVMLVPATIIVAIKSLFSIAKR